MKRDHYWPGRSPSCFVPGAVCCRRLRVAEKKDPEIQFWNTGIPWWPSGYDSTLSLVEAVFDTWLGN